MPYEDINQISVIIFSSIIVVCSISLIICIRFQNKQNRKYKECLKLIKEKENGTLTDNNLGVNNSFEFNELMIELYNTYLELINKLNNNKKEFDNLLDGFAKEFYENKIDIYIMKNCFEIIDNINLEGYSLVEYNDRKLKFRIKTTCTSYKKINEEIISGDSLNKVEQINIITYIMNDNKWLISNIEKVYEKNLS